MYGRKHADSCPTKTLPCAVCGLQACNGAGWFLVAENSWLDRLKILRWHPILAEQKEMRAVCCQQHLKTLLCHWLTWANLQFAANGSFRLTSAAIREATATDSSDAFVTSLVGELAVHRQSLSRVWSGSPEALECILDALLGGLTWEAPPRFAVKPPGEVRQGFALDPFTDGSRLRALVGQLDGA